MSDPILRFGADSKLYRNSAVYAGPVWNETKNVNESLDCDVQWTKANATRRGTKIIMQEPTLAGITLSWKMLEDLGDANFLAFRAANYAKTVVDLLICSGVYTVAGETYLRCEYKITGFKKGETVDGINTYEITAEPCYSNNDPQAGITPIA